MTFAGRYINLLLIYHVLLMEMQCLLIDIAKPKSQDGASEKDSGTNCAETLLGRQQNKVQTPFIFVYVVCKSYASKYIECIIKKWLL